MYDLLPAENYKLPPEAEGLDTTPSVASSGVVLASASESATSGGAVPTESPAPGLIPMASIADKKSLAFNPTSGGAAGDRSSHRSGSGPASSGATTGSGGTGLAADLLGGDSEHLHSIGRTNTRRHIRSSPSTGSAVTTVLEQDEDGAPVAPGAAGRPISILQNNHLAPALARSSSHSSTPPLVTEQEIPADDHEAEAGGSGVAEASAASVPIIVEHDQHDFASDAPAEQESAEPPASAVEAPVSSAAESSEAEQLEPSAEPDAEPSAGVADAKPTDKGEPAEPVTIIVAGELAEARGGVTTATAADTKEGPPKEESADAPSSTETTTEETAAPAEEKNAKGAASAESTAPSAAKEEEATAETQPAAEDDASKVTEEAPEVTITDDKDTTEAEKEADAPKAKEEEAKPEPESVADKETKPAAED